MNNLRDLLLQQDGLDPSGIAEQELIRFRALLGHEKKRARRLAWLVQIPLWALVLILLGLSMSESLLAHLNIPFVTAGGVVMIGLWVVVIPLDAAHEPASGTE